MVPASSPSWGQAIYFAAFRQALWNPVQERWGASGPLSLRLETGIAGPPQDESNLVRLLGGVLVTG